MKNLGLLLVSLFTILVVNAQSERYLTAMKDNLDAMEKAKTSQEMEVVANKFNRIAQVEEDNWIPAYYTIYSFTIASFMTEDSDARDELLDKAQQLIEPFMENKKENKEFIHLQAFIYQARMSVNGSRGMIYGQKTNSMLMEAVELDPDYPVAHYLLGSNLLYTPKMFGGGAENALPHLEKAKELYSSFNSETPFFPVWGAERNESLLNDCKQKIES